MNQFTQRHYQALLGYLKTNLRSGALHDGSRLPPEEALAAELNFSVPSLREAQHLLEIFGLLTQDADGGYRLSHDVSRGFTDIFSLMLLLNQLKYSDVHRLRRSIRGRWKACPGRCRVPRTFPSGSCRRGPGRTSRDRWDLPARGAWG